MKFKNSYFKYCLLICFIVIGCGPKKIDSSDLNVLVSSYYEALSEGDADLLKQTRHIKFIPIKLLSRFESGHLYDKRGTMETFSNVNILGEPKLVTLNDGEIEYKVFKYQVRMGIKFESQKAYHTFLKDVYPALRENPDIIMADYKAEGWVKGVSVRQELKGLVFKERNSTNWYFCEANWRDMKTLEKHLSPRDFNFIRLDLRELKLK